MSLMSTEKLSANPVHRLAGAVMRQHRRLHSALPSWIYVPLRNALWRGCILHAVKLVDRINEIRGADFSESPPIHICLEYGVVRGEDYMRIGRKKVKMIQFHLHEAGIVLPDRGRILDFGCGAGRVLEAFGGNYERFGCDVKASPIAWIQKYRPDWTVAVNAFDPPLSAHFHKFDFIYALSVFTHMDQEHADAWARALHEILKPGGVLLVTVLDSSQDEIMRRFRLDPRNVKGRDFFYDKARNATFLSVRYLRQEWDYLFELVNYRPAHMGEQWVAVLRCR